MPTMYHEGELSRPVGQRVRDGFFSDPVCWAEKRNRFRNLCSKRFVICGAPNDRAMMTASKLVLLLLAFLVTGAAADNVDTMPGQGSTILASLSGHHAHAISFLRWALRTTGP